jgi:acetylornithine/N-succinyldiaminopimelate aminotransferase
MANRNLIPLNLRPEPAMVRGAGSYLWDEHGRRYLDFVQGWAVNCLGHNPPQLAEALQAQLHAVVNPGPAYHNRPALRLAALLAELSGLPRVLFGCTGAEINDAAVKLARKWGQKHKGGAYEVITTQDGFHGRTLAMTCATGKPGCDLAFPPAVPGFRKVPYGDLSAAEQAISTHTVAIMLEPIQGEAGVVVPPPDYLQGLRALCDRHGLLLMVDEVQTGIARCGPLFAHQLSEVQPDIMTLGKGLGAGLPLSALLCREQVACFELGDHGGTFAGHALLCSVGLAVLETLRCPRATKLREARSRELQLALEQLARRHALRVRGSGFLWALVLPSDTANDVRDRALASGLLVNAPRNNVLRLMPALDVESAHIAEMSELLDAALS